MSEPRHLLRSIRRMKWETRRAVTMFVIVAVVFEVINTSYFSTNDAFTVVEGLTTLGLASLAMGLTMLAGEFDLAIPSTAACAGIVAVDLAGHGIVVAILAACGVGLGIGLVQGVLIWWLRINSLVLTIGSQIALGGLATLISHNKTVVASNLSLSIDIQQRWWLFSPGSLLAIAAFFIVGGLLAYTHLGREIRAVGGARGEAIGSGIELWRPIITVFAISGLLSGLLGALSTIAVGSASATQFSTLLLNAVAGALIGGISLRGGRGTVLGIAIGVFVLEILSSGLTLIGAAFYVDELATGALLLLVIASDIARGALTLGGLRGLMVIGGRGPGGGATLGTLGGQAEPAPFAGSIDEPPPSR